MTNDDKATNPRDQLVAQIAEGDVPKLVALTATMLANEVLPALDEIKRQYSNIHGRLAYTSMALAEIEVIYEQLQDLVPRDKNHTFAVHRVRLQERLEEFLKWYPNSEQYREHNRNNRKREAD